VAGAAIDRDDPGDEKGPLDVQLAVETEGAGTVTSVPAGIRCPDRCDGAFPRQSPIVLTARPAPDTIFAGSRGGGCDQTDRCRLVLGQDATVTAAFRQAPAATATLTVEPPANGRVTSRTAGIDCPDRCRRTLPIGTPVELTATAAEGFAFSEWSGACTGGDTCPLVMSADRTVAASFGPRPTVEVTVIVTGDGSVTSNPAGIDCGEDCGGAFPAGEPVMLTAAGDFIGWGDACSESEPSCTLTPLAATSVTASFVTNVS
jgi:hypothetical protein